MLGKYHNSAPAGNVRLFHNPAVFSSSASCLRMLAVVTGVCTGGLTRVSRLFVPPCANDVPERWRLLGEPAQ